MFLSLLVLTFPLLPTAGATCPCDGIVLNGSDSEQHCWQIESRLESTWSDADESCVVIGGHIGNPSDDVFAALLSYVQQVSSLPVLTGIVSGSGGELKSYAQMCQSNNLYNQNLNSTDLFSNDPSNDSTCAFISGTSSELVFLDCGTNASVLCDRPLETVDYCNIKANCSSTTTLLSTTTEQSVSTSNTSLTSPTSATTQFNSSLPTGGTSSLLDTTTISAESTKTSGSGSGGDSGNTEGTCNCNNVDSTTTVAPVTSGSCSQPTGCLKHQWKIFKMCVDWRAMLALIGIGLLLFLCCCICHFCMHACMFCTPAAKRDRVVRDPILQTTSVIAPVPLPLQKKVDYDVEKSDMVVLPPAAIQPDPVIITVPERHESVYGFHTKEIIHMMPDKPLTRDIGTMTDLMEITTPVLPVGAPAIKRKTVIKKPKKMFIPATLDPMESIEEDIAAEIPIDVPQSPGARSVAPLGDVIDPTPPSAPLNFVRNPKPLAPEGKVPHDDLPVGPRWGGENTPPGAAAKPNNRDDDEFDPRGLRSPPPPAGRNNEDAPRRMTFSPIADDSDEDAGARIPSPPRERKASGPKNNSGTAAAPPQPDVGAPADRPTLKNKRLNEMPSPSPGDRAENAPGAPARSQASNNPFASLGGSSPAPAPLQEGAGRGPEDDVGMRAARGRLGGAVRGGGGGGEAPSGWKPWAKGGARR